MSLLELGDPLTPFDFQRADIDNLLTHDMRGFVVAETGAGKSLIAIQSALESDLATKLVIQPKSTQDHVWLEGILRQDPNARVRTIDGTPPGKQAMSDLELGYPGWYLATPNIFTRWDFSTVRPDLTIIDEAHMLGRRDSKGERSLRKLKTGHPIVMSGTIARNHIENMWGLLRFVYPEKRQAGGLADISYNRWVKNYMATVYDHFAVGNIKIVGELEPGRIASEIDCWVSHFKRAECCDFHPNGFLDGLEAPITIKRSVDLTPAQKKAIARMESEYLAYLSTPYGEKRALHAKLPLSAHMRLRQMTLGLPSLRETGKFNSETGEPLFEVWFEEGCESPKLDDFREVLHQSGDEPYLSLTSSEKFATEAVRRLNEWGIPAEKWAGTVKQAERGEIKQRFTSGETRVVVGVVAAVSTGIDGLQYASSSLYHFDTDEDLTNEIQVEGRLDRRGQVAQVVNTLVLARGSMDEGVIGKQLAQRLSLNESLQRKAKSEAWKQRIHGQVVQSGSWPSRLR